MLKLKLETIEGLPSEIAKEYKKQGDVYVLDTDVTWEDTTALKNALAAEKKQRKEATEKVTLLESEKGELAEQVESLKATGKKPSEIEASWKEKLRKAEEAAQTKTDNLKKQLQTVLVDNVANQLAAEISTAPELLVPHIKARLTISEEDGQMLTRVLDSEGKASAASVNELRSEIIADKKFAPIITASKASGGGASGGKPGAPAGGKAFKDMSEGEKVALYKSNPTEFNRLSKDAAA